MRTKQEVIDFLESKVGGGVKCIGNSSLDSQCVTLIKSLMEFLGVPSPYKARGHAKTAISAYLNEGIADPATGFISVFSNKDMGSGFGHIWCNAGEGDGIYYESNGVKALTVTKGKTYSFDSVCNFDKYIRDGEPTDNSMMEIKKTEFTRLIDEANAKDTKISELTNDLEGEKSKTDEVRKELNTFMETLASKLTVITDKAEIIGAVERLLSQESEMTQKLVQAEKAYISLESDKKDEIGQLKKEISELRTTNERQSKMIEKLEDRIDNIEEPTPTKTFLEIIRDLFKRS